MFPQPRAPEKAPNPMLVGVVLLATLGALALMPATFLFLFVTMLPTMILAWTDRNRDQMRVQTMASMNAAGAFPFLVRLWTKGNTIDVAIPLLARPMTLITILGAVACGWLLLIVGPQMAARAITYMNKREAQTLKVKNRELIQVWGDEMPEDAQRVRSGKTIQ